MSTEDNKAIVGRWFTEFWGENFNAAVIDELAAPEIRFEYSLHAPCRGRDEVRSFATKFRAAFPDLAFEGTADLIAEGDYVVGQWVGGGTHTGPAFDDMPLGGLPAATGRTMRFSGTTVLKVENGLITEEIGLDDGVSALQQLGLVRSDGSRGTCEPARIQHHRSGSATLCRADLTFVPAGASTSREDFRACRRRARHHGAAGLSGNRGPGGR